MFKTKTYIESYYDRLTGEYVEHETVIEEDRFYRPRKRVGKTMKDPWADPKNAWSVEDAPF